MLIQCVVCFRFDDCVPMDTCNNVSFCLSRLHAGLLITTSIDMSSSDEELLRGLATRILYTIFSLQFWQWNIIFIRWFHSLFFYSFSTRPNSNQLNGTTTKVHTQHLKPATVEKWNIPTENRSKSTYVVAPSSSDELDSDNQSESDSENEQDPRDKLINIETSESLRQMKKISRCRIGHGRLTHSYLLSNEERPGIYRCLKLIIN
jgi:hypothetical protein